MLWPSGGGRLKFVLLYCTGRTESLGLYLSGEHSPDGKQAPPSHLQGKKVSKDPVAASKPHNHPVLGSSGTLSPQETPGILTITGCSWSLLL